MDKNQKLSVKSKVESKPVVRAEDLVFGVGKKNTSTAIINSINSYLPGNKFSTSYFLDKLKSRLSLNLIQQIQDLGIEQKYIGCDIEKYLDTGKFDINESNSEMAKKSVLNLLGNSCVKANEIDYLITVSDTSDFISPGLSNQLIGSCGFKKEIRHISISGMGCSGFSKALEVANDYLTIYPENRVLIVISVINSAYCQNINRIDNYYTIDEIQNSASLKNNQDYHIDNWLNIIQFFLFGDAACSILVSSTSNQNKPQLKLIDTKHLTNIKENDYQMAFFPTGGSLYPEPNLRPRFFMHKNLPKTGLIYSKKLLNTIEEKDLGDIKKWVVHTDSKKIIDIIKQGLEIEADSIKESYETIKDYGNITPCSLPITLEKVMANDCLDINQKVVLLGFGNGFSASLSILSRVN
jgi:3-oxoacyl-[acyl-carrier-protein] synthase III